MPEHVSFRVEVPEESSLADTSGSRDALDRSLIEAVLAEQAQRDEFELASTGAGRASPARGSADGRQLVNCWRLVSCWHLIRCWHLAGSFRPRLDFVT